MYITLNKVHLSHARPKGCLTIYHTFWFIVLIVQCLLPFSTVIQLYCSGQYTYPCFPGTFFTNTLHNILSKPLAAFPHNHLRDNGQREERNESCCNDYHQSSESFGRAQGLDQQPPVLKSCILPTKLWGSTPHNLDFK